jgi:hypothetical protein
MWLGHIRRYINETAQIYSFCAQTSCCRSTYFRTNAPNDTRQTISRMAAVRIFVGIRAE